MTMKIMRLLWSEATSNFLTPVDSSHHDTDNVSYGDRYIRLIRIASKESIATVSIQHGYP